MGESREEGHGGHSHRDHSAVATTGKTPDQCTQPVGKPRVEDGSREHKDGGYTYRRAIEAGSVVEVDGTALRSVGNFLKWAHARYHALEDGYDSWYGDDKS